jgi:cytochrome c oxidase subunit 1
VATAEEVLAAEQSHADAHIHMPSPSYWPIVVAATLPVIALGIIYGVYVVSIVGVLLMVFGIFGWAMEPGTAPDSDFDPPSVDDGEPTTELVRSE